MKIAVLIMAANIQPSIRNIDAFEKSVISDYNDYKYEYKNEYDFYIYSSNDNYGGGVSNVSNRNGKNNVFDVTITEKESVYRTYEKTYWMFKWLYESKDYDFIVRVNISMWLNMRLLDAVISQMNERNVYCNAINSHVNLNSEYLNDIYPRGDMYITGYSVMKDIVDAGSEYLYCDSELKNRISVEHVDDCLLGLVLIKIFGKDYYKHIISLRYNFFPMGDLKDANKIDGYSIGSRVKTVPPGEQSGYSWDDNEYRLMDGKKMIELSSLFNAKKYDYSNISLNSLETTRENERPTLFVTASNQSVKDVFWKYLEMKRK